MSKRIREAAAMAQETGNFTELARVYNEEAMELIDQVLAKHTSLLLKTIEELVRKEVRS
jgi:hypothetical protein